MTTRTITFDDEQWQVVPREPTEDMLLRGYSALMAWDARTGDDNGIREVFRAMLANAPEPPAQEPGTAAEIEALRAEIERLRADARRLDWIEAAADARKIEIARSLYGTGYEIGEWPSMHVSVTSGSLRAAIDAAMEANNEG